ncbi:MAG: ArgE/DapE family deacylase [Alphaproteobacteria bacterium]|nr:ArgE/DapE family deacylase [Alphaproteobacteria bacterium]
MTAEMLDFIDRNRERAERFLAALVRIPSDNPPGDLAQAAEKAKRLLEGFGLTVESHPVPADLAAANGMKSATNLIVRRKFGPGPTIALNAHGDVVPPGEGWSRDPYGAEIVDGWMYGRGAAVSKSDFATYAFALMALETAKPSRGTVELHLTYDEEVGGEIGPGHLLKAGLSKPDMVICAGFSYAVVAAHNGCLHLEVGLRGRSAHAASPSTGVDALEAASQVLSALYAWRKGLASRVSKTPGIGAAQMTVGLIKGGINTNVVPDAVTLRLDRRMIPEEDPVAVEAELRDVITKAVAVAGATVEIRRVLLARPLTSTDASRKMAETLSKRASEVLGEAIAVTGVPLYTDARHYAEAGIPTILYGAGPRTILEANAHRADERIKLDDLNAATKVIALTLKDLLA